MYIFKLLSLVYDLVDFRILMQCIFGHLFCNLKGWRGIRSSAKTLATSQRGRVASKVCRLSMEVRVPVSIGEAERAGVLKMPIIAGTRNGVSFKHHFW